MLSFALFRDCLNNTFFPRYKSSIFFKRIGRIKEIFQSNLCFSKLLTERAPVLQSADCKSGLKGTKKESYINCSSLFE